MSQSQSLIEQVTPNQAQLSDVEPPQESVRLSVIKSNPLDDSETDVPMETELSVPMVTDDISPAIKEIKLADDDLVAP